MRVRMSSDVSAAADVAADEADPQVVGGVALGAALLGHELWGLERARRSRYTFKKAK